jgi:LacI family transcriptional regulator
MTQKRVKLKDIADELNVSVGLVSLVLGGKAKAHRISDAISKKVLQKAEEMGYQANQIARGLRTGKTGVIGLIVADIANPYFGQMARCLENGAAKLGYQVMFGSSDEDDMKLNQLVNVFLSRQVDGMIVVPVKNSHKILSKMKNQSIPIVLIDRYCDGLEEDFVCSDNFEGSSQLTTHLLNKGYSKIAAFVYNTEVTNLRDRIKGYVSAVQKAMPSENPEDSIFEVGFKNIDGRLESAIETAIGKGCDALFFANNSLGILSLNILDKLGKSVPNDIGLVSFDNPEAFQIAKPGITCFQQPVGMMCTEAIRILSAKINNEKLPDYQRLLQGSMVLRGSC